jgi:uncharacterized delta-60 repeat protein
MNKLNLTRKRMRLLTLCSIIVLFATTISAASQSGSLDTRFGEGGKVTFETTNLYTKGNAIALQSDGGIVVAGSTNNNGADGDILVLRYTSDGRIDRTFGKNGVVTTSLSSLGEWANSIAIQSDGKIIVGGTAQGGFGVILVRYNSNGTLDKSFGVRGVSANYVAHNINKIEITGDGKIVAVGHRFSGTNDFAVIRYNSDGNLDSSFGTGGTVYTDFDGASDFAYDLAIESSGNIIVAGDSSLASGQSVAIAKYNTDGTPDLSFGTNGSVTTDLPGSSSRIRGAALGADTAIYVAGASDSPLALTIAKYQNNGYLDLSFGRDNLTQASGGVVTTSGSQANTIVAPGRNEIFVGGSGSGSFLVQKLNKDGSLDTRWGLQGGAYAEFGSNSEINDLAINESGDVFAVGYVASSSGGRRLGLVKFKGQDKNFRTSR